MKVIKLGGSLARCDALVASLDSIGHIVRTKALVVVPGGGVFADQVRELQKKWQFHDYAAHAMAILAMQQMALMVQALQPGWKQVSSLDELRATAAEDVVIWSPHLANLDQAGIAASWEITSDSLAAWLAGQLDASELIIVKSATVDSTLTIAEMQAQGIVDRAFHQFIENARFTLTVINYRNILLA